MADLSKNAEKVLELVETLTIVELADLVSAMEEKFGVSAAAPVATGGAVAATEDEERQHLMSFLLLQVDRKLQLSR